ncbi:MULTISPECIES: enoyl-CoA hydratase/isomerase family protein [Acidithrix]|uniref:enoyl-CoA hydratase n=1 Tax=Acidithrix ferrooxidans TaxID=1280514 RepID=A0A0D8HJE8_9ACTN|nr:MULTISPECIES: enoyl-CoA hydratase/isomerase family protein [Acidithrix]KJF17877.1 putative enoyl-CoA hydratase echA8 [Acidithrix ferrooxidans]CAG4929224.1 unnamed protein product [Acidithrix sp. C25]
MKNELIKYESIGEVGVIKLDRPKANAISPELLEELLEVAQELRERPPRALVIWGGEKIFAAGADISRFGGPVEALHIGGLFHKALDAIVAIPRPTIAAISGFALGGGCELALACDFRVASPEAKMGQPEILLGIIPGGGGTQRLPRLIGSSRAKDLIFSGRQVNAQEALSIGLIDRIAPSRETLLETAMEWAQSLAQGASASIGLAKRAIDLGLSDSLHHGLSLELRLFAESFTTKDSEIGVSSFLENGPGKAQFTGE